MAAGKKGPKRPPAKRGGAPAKNKRPPAKGSSQSKAAPASRKGSGSKRPAAQPTRREKEARALRNRLIFGALLLVIAGGVIFFAARPDATGPIIEQLEAGAGGCDYDTKHDGTAADQDEHIPNPTFKVDPPAGGSHEPQAANPGFYRPGKAPSDGQLVHANEHGFIILWYRPDLPPEKFASIEDLSDEFGRELIVVPRPTLAGEVAVTAWHKRLVCGELVPEKIALFTGSFKDKGPEKGFL